jgi:hypothetical protein
MYQNTNLTLQMFLEEISGIADKEYQLRVWIQGKGPECDDFDEAVCRYSNAANCIFEEYVECWISDVQMDLVTKFHEEYKKFWEENDLPQLFIDTLEWTKITLMAKEVLRVFNNQAKHVKNKVE